MQTQEVSLEQLWEMCRHKQLSQVARLHGKTMQGLLSEFRRSGLLGNGPTDPSPEEIQRETAMIRSSWDEATERARWIGSRTVDLT